MPVGLVYYDVVVPVCFACVKGIVGGSVLIYVMGNLGKWCITLDVKVAIFN